MKVLRKNGGTPDKFLSGEETRCWRLARRLTQPELAKWLGVSPQAVSKMEQRGVSRVVALALAAIDRGLQPMKPSPEDYEAAQQPIRKEDMDEGE
ncbi:DNA-binding XRE family transcriptional regulator [Bradyrhizobium diazoefficiens]|uniref:helix-turn-helix transcriptional regulator n=1 Tax=Bradyrhizobium diazoefficiens TaxID=1355477 RepID=UPI00351133C5